MKDRNEVCPDAIASSWLPVEPMESEVDGHPLIITPPGWQVNDITARLKTPTHIERGVQFDHLDSFVEYVNAFKEAGTACWVCDVSKTEFSPRVTAYIDYHVPGRQLGDAEASQPRWCRHTAVFDVTPRPAWNEWFENDGKMMDQAAFADFLHLNRVDVIDPAGAELLEIIATLKATANGEYKNMVDEFTGSAEIIYTLKVNAQGGTVDRPLEVPKEFTVKLQPFYGCPELTLKAELRIRIPKRDGEKLQIGYRFYRLADELDQLCGAIVEQLKSDLGVPVWR